jgi:pyruvate-formate lyase-activating enzyme
LGENGVDFVAMDIKNKASLYPETAGCTADVEGIMESIRGIVASGISYLFRTTMVKPFVAPDDILEIAKMLSQLGVRYYRLQPYLKSEKSFMKDVLPENQYKLEEIDALQLEVDKVLTHDYILAA